MEEIKAGLDTHPYKSKVTTITGETQVCIKEKLIFTVPNATSKTITEATQRYREECSEACFAAGTLVHTKEGLVAIEKIKVGDWVLSKPENGGEQAYKRVLKTFAHAPTSVIEVYGKIPGTQNEIVRVVSTLNHPFWLVGEGWTAADKFPLRSQFELVDGSNTRCLGNNNIYASDVEGVGWVPAHLGDLSRPGIQWDYINDKLVADYVMAIERIQALEEEHPLYTQNALEEAERSETNYPYLKLPVYNLEVEDFHTYYVGRIGIWVHNTNCGGLQVEVKAGEVLSEAMIKNPY
ncbi:polymorphic toxin-type HINT domain-containing protein [Undibacterium curvum]|uniref:Intein C-terminal splicing domain-containing protein n=1 Tax=Undibacterium curvum TaxID=2762294 RepID=A0ABR7A8Z7_9BURK|nr:polymorphic toxin-type HINT domain-containing protein [Undibacterium curvum]MBC3933283.1 hypothetical protein [Undibacterium curvum]